MNRYPQDTDALFEEFLVDRNRDWVTEFEHAFLEKLGGKYAVAVNSATSGLHAALLALGIGPGDEVITPGLTVVMDAFSCLYVGATPTFADVDPQTHNVTAESIEATITKDTKAIIIVDWQGLPCDYDSIKAVADKHSLPVILDAAQTIGARYKGQKQNHFFDFTVYSFEQKKHMTTGSEGGLVVCNNSDLAVKLRKYAGIGYKHLQADAGRTSLGKSTAQDPNYFRFGVVGLNYRMNAVSAMLGLAQLNSLDSIVRHRVAIAETFLTALREANLHELFRYQKASNYEAVNTYYTLALIPKFQVNWKDLYDKFVQLGGKPFYAAMVNPYLELPVAQQAQSWQTLSTGLCPVAEEIQKKVICLKTNYISILEAKNDALRFCTAVQSFL